MTRGQVEAGPCGRIVGALRAASPAPGSAVLILLPERHVRVELAQIRRHVARRIVIAR